MKGWLPVFKKELLRFFKDKRMIVGTLILPGLLIYLVYSFMGDGMRGIIGGEDRLPAAYVQNMPETLGAFFDGVLETETVTAENAEAAKEAVKNGEKDILIVFPENFSNEKPEAGAPTPNVEIYYNATESNSSAAFSLVSAILSEYEFLGENKYDINNPTSGKQYNLATERDMTSMIFSMLMPMLMMVFIFSGAMSVAPESIAGEKERGTFATLLVTPVSRAGVAVGKIFALSIIAVLSGLSSFIGIIFSLPKMMGGADVSAALYSVGDYFALLGVVVSTVLLTVALISVISAFAKSVKEATAYVTPLMIVNVLLSVTCMFGEGAPTSVWLYLIPLYNSVQSINAVFSFSVVALNLAVAMIANLAYTGLLVWLLTRMFKSEKIMFRR
ncbi:MAG: ABC transporter permease [Bacillota bacterium]|nr:MAG: ABC transporter permease [Bacillota bacterium]